MVSAGSGWTVIGRPAPTISPGDRGLAYGDGLFETVAVRNGVPRLLAYHLERLATGAMRLGITVSPAIESELAKLVAIQIPQGHGIAKIVLTRGESPRGYTPPAQPLTTTAIGAWPTEPAESVSPATADWAGLRLARQTRLAGMKHLNRLEQVLARAGEAAALRDELICCDTNSLVICGTMSNVFLVTDSVLQTPAITHAGVAGVMRRFVIELAQSAGIDISVGDVTVAEVQSAAEIFVTNSLYGIRPVGQFGRRLLDVGPLTGRLMEAAAAAGICECAS